MNNALELIKQGQLELYNARHTLERLYRGQHGDLELTNNNLTAPFENSAGLAVNGIQDINNEFDVDSISKSYSAHANAIPVMPDAESFQVQLDPYQFMEVGTILIKFYWLDICFKVRLFLKYFYSKGTTTDKLPNTISG